ncbi:MAG: bifunctional UDP-N-acetylglucosamine diphosphorylase/glucosamine-1-phosphate N-acetyltransferase GlmU [Rhodoluna sp.]|nr:bifunctional UDP-N-acetylglucosamine diphosphorylase/glucosamine-1-phosphate N-acetyltransferase GlmU [Rhodoluna sp.]
MSNKFAVIVLAAGSGTRMRSKTPKVMHELAGLPLLGHALSTAHALGAEHVIPVVRHEREAIVEYISTFYPTAVIADQDEIPGTGRAVECGLEKLDSNFDGTVVVTSGDVPLLDVATLQLMIEAHIAGGFHASVLSSITQDPTGLGRIIRNSDGHFTGIIEHRDATEEQQAIREVNAGVYVFQAASLREKLAGVGMENSQHEKYLTDVVAELTKEGGKVQALTVNDNWLVAGINDRVQLGEVTAELNRRLCAAWQRAGVTILDPASTWLDITVSIGEDVTILPGTILRGLTSIGAGSTIGPEVQMTDTRVGENATVVKAHVNASIIGDGASVGPFAYLRPGTELGAGGKIGTFVETKNAKIGAGSKVPHLSYVGDAEIGVETNIGAGTIFANYDGVNKHKTVIGSHVRSGSHNTFVAPITIGDGAYTAAGTTVRKDVASGDLGMNVTPQRNIADWVLSNRPGTKAAQAAEQDKN